MSMYTSYADLDLIRQSVKLEQELKSIKTSQRYGLAQFKAVPFNPITVPTYNINNYQKGIAGIFRFVGYLKDKTAVCVLNYGGYNSTGNIFTVNYLPSDAPNEVKLAVQIENTTNQVILGGFANMSGYLELLNTYTFPDQ